ncbi:Ubiquitin carboxyl-terminal hydrolase 48 [Hondaea fermentalgiana]|uniref:ubiquitinyl hydrolase 1 n=1 Tax=Hondaea fermentalgiana TaxID=2315210 RepID=A0A2R5GS10_9STRA|nr:Ubiquitin carboxyl-terminal hydrolase 48 [Hondaea fermentalgiana]|eukprot:GBG31131.1 Ubiquitin carboxyl-terminal hydrolase 48 [Hondaea fermentalgiana]
MAKDAGAQREEQAPAAAAVTVATAAAETGGENAAGHARKNIASEPEPPEEPEARTPAPAKQQKSLTSSTITSPRSEDQRQTKDGARKHELEQEVDPPPQKANYDNEKAQNQSEQSPKDDEAFAKEIGRRFPQRKRKHKSTYGVDDEFTLNVHESEVRRQHGGSLTKTTAEAGAPPSTGNKDESLAVMAKKLREDPLMRGKPACTAAMHGPGKKGRKRNCASNPNCLYGLGENSGIWTSKFSVSSLLGPDPRTRFREPKSLMPVGLINLGATCYVNALIQTLFMIPSFRHLIFSWTPATSPSTETEKHEAPMQELQLVFALMQNGNAKTQDLRKLVSLLELDSSYQQDAQEFHKLLLNLISGIAEKQTNPEVKGIGDMFLGSVDNVVKCLNCRKASKRPEDIQEIQVNIKGHSTLQSALEAYAAVERLEGHDQYECSNCNSKQDAERFVRIAKFPDVLIVLLNRFVWDGKQGTKKKVKDTIEIPESLDFAKNETLRTMLSESLHETISTNMYAASDLAYSLTAVLTHKGASANSGHYTADVLDVTQDPHVWYTMDDNKVSVIRNRPTSSRNAYMLVYRLKSSLRAKKKDLVRLSTELDAATKRANAHLDDELEAYTRRSGELEEGVSGRKNLYRKLFIDAASGPPHAGEVGQGVWVPTDWMSAWISGQDVPANGAPAAPLTNGTSGTGEPAMIDMTLPVSQQDPVDLSGDLDVQHRAENKEDDNDKANGNSVDDNDLEEEDEQQQQQQQEGKDDVNDAAAAHSLGDKKESPPDMDVVFSSPPDVTPYLCCHSDVAAGRARIGPSGAAHLKRVRPAVWDEMAAACRVEAKNRRALPYVVDEASQQDLACASCFGELRKRVELIQETGDARERIDHILRSSRISSARMSGDRSGFYYIAKAWAAEWLHYNKVKQNQAAEVHEMVAAATGTLGSSANGEDSQHRGRRGRGPAKGGRKKKGAARTVLEALSSTGGNEPSTDINASITCEHGELSLGNKDKQLLSAEDWDFVVSKALGGRCKASTRVYAGSHAACAICSESVRASKDQASDLASRKTAQLKDGPGAKALRALAKRTQTGRPALTKGVLTKGDYFVIPRGWLVRWRLFVNNRANDQNASPLADAMSGPEVTCEHGKRIVSPRLLHWLRRDGTYASRSPLTPEEMEVPRVSSNLVEIVSEAEWEALLTYYGSDNDSATALRLVLHEDFCTETFFVEDDESKQRFSFEPAICESCMDAKLKRAAHEATVYKDRRLGILLLPETAAVPSVGQTPVNSSKEDDEVAETPDGVTITAELAPSSSSSSSSSSSASGPQAKPAKSNKSITAPVRRSKRANDSAKKVFVSASSSMTLANLLVQVYYHESLQATLDQIDPDWLHTYHRGKRLEDLSLTLEQAGVHADDEICLKITKSSSDDPDFDGPTRWYELLQNATENDVFAVSEGSGADKRMQATLTAGGLGVASLTFLLLGCGLGGAWWPLFNVFFIVLLVLPMMFGSHESTGLVGGLGDFLESGMALTIFAFPTVLYRVDELKRGVKQGLEGQGSSMVVLLPSVESLVSVAGVYSVCAVLHVLLPARRVQGYACDRRGKPLTYRLNGLRVLLVTLVGWASVCSTGLIRPEFMAERAWDHALAANIVGLCASLAMYVMGLKHEEEYARCATRDRPEPPKPSQAELDAARRRRFATRFYLGLEYNPRLGNQFDIKMFLYLAGACMLALNVCSAAAQQRAQSSRHGLSNAMIAYVVMMGWFLCEYMFFEEIHLYTYDLFCEKVGFKLTWGSDETGCKRALCAEEIEREFMEIDMLTDSKLREIAKSDDLESVTSLALRVDTTDQAIAQIGYFLPNLRTLTLDRSVLASFRDFGTSLRHLRVLNLAASQVRDLDGISALDALQELHIPGNYVRCLTPLAMHEQLRVLDARANLIGDLNEVDQLGTCPELSHLFLQENPIANVELYRRVIVQLVPGIEHLDETPVEMHDREPISDTTMDEIAAFLESLPTRIHASWEDHEQGCETMDSQGARWANACHGANDELEMIRARPSTPRGRSGSTRGGFASPLEQGSFGANSLSDRSADKTRGETQNAADASSNESASALTHGSNVVFAGNLAASMRRRKKASQLETNQQRLKQVAASLASEDWGLVNPEDDLTPRFGSRADVEDLLLSDSKLSELLALSDDLERDLRELQLDVPPAFAGSGAAVSAVARVNQDMNKFDELYDHADVLSDCASPLGMEEEKVR